MPSPGNCDSFAAMKLDQNTVVVITGASRGIGKEAAFEFARRGTRIVLASRDQARLETVAKEVRALGAETEVVVCDVSKEERCRHLIDQALKRFGQVDVLVNNAGFGHYAAVENLTTSALREIFDTNLYGSIWCAQAVLPHMKERKRGHIVNVSTVISKRSLPFMTAYCMTKFAMNAMDEGLRIEVRPYGIGVSLVCPGLTATDFQDNAKKTGPKRAIDNGRGMPAKIVGKAIVKAVAKNRRRVSLTLSGRLLGTLQRISPTMVDEIMWRFFKERKKRSTEASA